MAAQLIDGKQLAKKLCCEIARDISVRSQQGIKPPSLAVILVGDHPASHLYVKKKRQACAETGIESIFYPLPAETKEEALLALIETLNQDDKVDGILLQLPLPDSIDSEKVLESISPDKDVDGFHPYHLGRLAQRRPLLRPCTPYGIILLLNSINETYKNRHAVIIGASNIVGRPMALELLLAGSTVTVCHRFTKELSSYVSQGDIVISAVGRPHLISGAWIKPGATVIDVGINHLSDGQIVGDIEFHAAKQHAAWITPVPGGVGPMTITVLLQNTLTAAIKHSVTIKNK